MGFSFSKQDIHAFLLSFILFPPPDVLLHLLLLTTKDYISSRNLEETNL